MAEKYNLPEGAIGRRATDTQKAVYPQVDVFGKPYLRAGIYQMYLNSTEFVVIPIGRTWKKERRESVVETPKVAVETVEEAGASEASGKELIEPTGDAKGTRK